MKKLIITLCLFVSFVDLYSQEQPKQIYTKEYYLQKSKSQKKTGWILLAGGTAMIIGGAIGFDQNFEIFGPDDHAVSADVYGFVLLGGVVADLISIPFFVSSGHYRKIAATLTVNNENILLPQHATYVLTSVPSLSLKIKF